MNKEELKQIYITASYKSILDTVEFYLPMNLSEEVYLELRANVARAMCDALERAEKFASGLSNLPTK